MAGGGFGGGDGSSSNPYLVEDAADFNAIRNIASRSFFKQTADFSLSAYSNWEPLSPAYTSLWDCVYDGDGHRITDLSIDRSGPEFEPFGGYGVSLFAKVTWDSDGAVRKLILDGFSVKGVQDVGSILSASGRMKSQLLLQDCVAMNGTVEGETRVGGMISGIWKDGWGISASVGRCGTYNVTVIGGSSVGGFIGLATNPVGIYDCFSADGSVTASSGSAGGFVGLVGFGGTIQDPMTAKRCYAANACSGNGFVGSVDADFDPIDCYHNSSMGSDSYIPGRTTGQMTYPKSANTYAEWHFGWGGSTYQHGWWHEPGRFGGYPHLPLRAYATVNSNNQDGVAMWLEKFPQSESDSHGSMRHRPMGTELSQLGQQVTYILWKGWRGYIPEEDDEIVLTEGKTFLARDDTDAVAINTEISTAEDLWNIRYGSDGAYELTSNINLKDFVLPETHPPWDRDYEAGTFPPIFDFYYDPGVSGSFFTNIAFTGFIDGQGHTVRNAKLQAPLYFGVGLIRLLSGTIQDLYLQDVSVSGIAHIGALAGQSLEGSLVEGCWVSGCVGTATGENLGGLVGTLGGAMEQCTAFVNLAGDTYVGGLIGKVNSSALVENCFARGILSANEYAGGLCSSNLGTLVNCYSTVEVNCDVNGFGFAASRGQDIIDCYYDVELSGKSDDILRGFPRTTEQMTDPYDKATTYRGWNFGQTLATGIIETTIGNAFVHTGADPWGWEGRINVGEQITSSGFEFEANNGTFTVTGTDGVNLFVNATLTPESSGSTKKIVRVAPQVWWIHHGTNDGYPVLFPLGVIDLFGHMPVRSDDWEGLLSIVRALFGQMPVRSDDWEGLLSIVRALFGEINALSFWTTIRLMQIWAKRDGVYEPVSASAKSGGEYHPVVSVFHKTEDEYKE